MRRSHIGIQGVKKDNYPGLPDVLKEFNYYYQDGETGHVIMAIPESLLNEAIHNGDLDMFECPVPCKYVLEQGFRMYESHVVVDCNYDEFLGIVIDSSYYEYDNVSSNIRDDMKIVTNVVGEKFFLPIQQESTHFDTSDTAANLIIGFNSPTPEEILQFDSQVRTEFRLTTVSDILFILVKIGKLNWMDASYNPSTVSSLKPLEFDVEDGTGIPLWIYLVDTKTNILKAQRLITWGTRFSRDFQRMAKDVATKSKSVADFDYRLTNVYSKYTTKDLLKFAGSYYKAGDK